MNGVHAARVTRAAPATTLLPVAIVQEAAAGDRVAFARLVAAYHADLVCIAHVVSGDEQIAQDAAQSAWTIAWRKLGTVRDPERARPWLARAAANEARQAFRGRRRERLAEIHLDDRIDGDPRDPRGDDPWDEIERVDLAGPLMLGRIDTTAP
jgi:DNA-directed RNA polymerase specialized sigma24 family protein